MIDLYPAQIWYSLVYSSPRTGNPQGQLPKKAWEINLSNRNNVPILRTCRMTWFIGVRIESRPRDWNQQQWHSL